MSELFTLLTIFYVTVISGLFYGVLKVKNLTKNYLKKPDKPFKVTIAIPARNEETNILSCLHSILTPDNIPFIEKILVLNDDSTDNTQNVVERLIPQFPFIECITCIREPNQQTSPKKRLITQAINLTTTDWLVLTDADCVVSNKWIKTMATHVNENISMVCGPVEFIEKENWFSQWQKIEFAGMAQVVAGSIGFGRPTTCNAANLWINKHDFLTVHGFEGVDTIISGDDELLMHKFHSRKKNSITFVFDQSAVVRTYAFETFSEFMNQRKRWASKGLRYQSVPYRIFLMAIWFYHFMVVAGLVYAIFSPDFRIVYAIGMILKIVIDTMTVMKANNFLTKPIKLIPSVAAQIIQNPYIVLAGFLGTFGSFTWKGVTYKK